MDGSTARSEQLERPSLVPALERIGPTHDRPIPDAVRLPRALSERIAEAAGMLLRLGIAPPEIDPRDDLELADAALRSALDAVRARLGESSAELPRRRLAEAAGLVVELQELRDEMKRLWLGERTLGLECVQEALSRLRGVDSADRMMDRVTAVLCETCGFDRALLYRIENARMILESVHFKGDPEWAEQVKRFTNSIRPSLAPRHSDTFETEMFRKRAPILVTDPESDERSYKPMVEAMRLRSYVAAPIVPAGRVIGFLHADAYFSGRRMGILDRDILATFAEGFGYALERSLVYERLRAQRDQVRQLVRSTEAVVGELADAETELRRTSDEGVAVTKAAAAIFVAPESRLETLLTRRELEVLDLVARGATNAAIADQLVISPGTVKSHVKHILRKLRAANRAEAVSRYIRLRGQGG